MATIPRTVPLPQNLKAPQKPVEGASETEKTLTQVQDLLFGTMRQELTERVDHMGDQFADFEQYVRGELRKASDDLRAAERRQEDHRRQALKEIAAAMDLMATNVRRLAE